MPEVGYLDQPVEAKRRKTADANELESASTDKLDNYLRSPYASSSVSDADSDLMDLEGLAATSPPVPVDLPTVCLFSLPTEILLIITRYLRTDILAGILLPRVCRGFRLLMHVPAISDLTTMGVSREEFEVIRRRNDGEWRQRLKVNFGSTGKSFFENWEEAWHRHLRFCCINCGMQEVPSFRDSTRFGQRWLDGPSYSVMCRPCQRTSTFGVIMEEDALDYLELRDFAHLPFQLTSYRFSWRRIQLVKEYHRPSIMQIYEEKEVKRDVFRAQVSAIFTRLSASDTFKTASPSLDSYPRGMGPKSRTPCTWADAIDEKRKTIRDFIAAVDRTLLAKADALDVFLPG